MVKLDKIISECKDGEILTFPLRLCGSIKASTKTKPATTTIELPADICDRDVTDYINFDNKYLMVVLAVDRKVMERLCKEEVKDV